MSILGGMVDSHHEMELSPSTQLVRSNWFARHFFALLLLGSVLAVGLCSGMMLR